MTGLPWDASYRDGPAPWDTGRPQPAIVRVASEGGFAGAVLDAGCGTGENALHVASLGLPVLGVDVAETALAIARAKAGDRGIEVEFAAADAFRLERLGRRFSTVLDCGLFHTFDGGERPGYVASLASVTEHDGTLYVLCFSDDGPGTGQDPPSLRLTMPEASADAAPSAMITGATGGIGRAIASRLARTGYRLTLSGRDGAALAKVASDLADSDAELQVMLADMTVRRRVRALARSHAERFGSMDLLVLSAGTGISGRIAEYPMRRFDRQMSVNVRAPFALVQECLPELVLALTRMSARSVIPLVTMSRPGETQWRA